MGHSTILTQLTKTQHTPLICTFSGRRVNPLDLHPDDIDILDIAHGLSNVCRYGGHCKEFFSVAQHSVLVSENVSSESYAWGLLHDASEAYIGDIPAQLKATNEYSFYREIEERIMDVVAIKFGLTPEPLPEVKKFDLIVRETEMRDFGSVPKEFRGDHAPLKKVIIPLSPKKAREQFLDRYYALFGTGAFV